MDSAFSKAVAKAVAKSLN